MDFIQAPLPKKPRQTAPKADWDAYEQERLKCNINLYGAERIKHLRERNENPVLFKSNLKSAAFFATQ